jgi:hypothetical protein
MQLPQQPMYPQPPPPQKKSVPWLLIVGIVLGCLFVACCGFGAINVLLNPTRRAGVTHHPTATPAPADASIFAPTVGGTTADFLRKYGPATDGSGLSYDATIAGQRVQITLALDEPGQSFDGRAHVTDVEVQATDFLRGSEPWSATTANAIAKAFLPADAHFQRTGTITPMGNGNGFVRDNVYYSSGMAATFTPGAFTNGFGDRRVPVGTVHYFCQTLPPATSGYAWCIITIGTY